MNTKSASKRPHLCINWEDNVLTIAKMRIDDSRPVVDASWRVEHNPGVVGDPRRLGKYLHEEFERQKIPFLPAFVAVPRRRLLMKSFLQREVADVDIVDAVLLQVESRYPAQLDELVVDFIDQPGPKEGGEQIILAGAAAVNVIDDLRTALQAASIQILGIGTAELGLASLTHRVCQHEMALSVLVDQDNLEFVISRSGTPLFSQSLPLPKSSTEHDSVIEKLLDHLEQRTAEFGFPPVESACVFGNAPPQIQASIEPRFENFQLMPTGDAGLARLQGLTASFLLANRALDFNSPRQPVNHAAIRRNRRVLVACLCALVLGIAGVWLSKTQNQLDERIASLRDQHALIQGELDANQTVFAEAEAISDWSSHRTKWSVELHKLLDLIGSNQRCYLQRLRLDGETESAPVSVQVSGHVRQKDDALEIFDRLAFGQQGVQVFPGPIQPSDQDPYYGSRFDARIEWHDTTKERTDVQE